VWIWLSFALALAPALRQTISTVDGNGTAGLSGDNSPGEQASLNQPVYVIVNGAGSPIVAD